MRIHAKNAQCNIIFSSSNLEESQISINIKKKGIAKLYYVCMKEYSTTLKNMSEHLKKKKDAVGPGPLSLFTYVVFNLMFQLAMCVCVSSVMPDSLLPHGL